MKVVVTGGTGFIGSALCASLAADQHDVAVLSRFSGGTYQGVRHVRAQPIRDSSGVYRFEGQALAEINGADAVINLAGAGIADERWTASRKAILKESRLSVTRALVDAIQRAAAPPKVLISGSAIGYYGSSLIDTFVESSPAGSDFLAQLCVEWEIAARSAESDRTRVVFSRTGLVLARGGGLVAKMKTPFTFFVGGPIGSGANWMSWIHRDDWIAMVKWAMTTDTIRGALNVTAPGAVTNKEFSKALGRAMHRPSAIPVPTFVLRTMFGELADVALFASQRVTPLKAEENGFAFKYANVDDALKASV